MCTSTRLPCSSQPLRRSITGSDALPKSICTKPWYSVVSFSGLSIRRISHRLTFECGGNGKKTHDGRRPLLTNLFNAFRVVFFGTWRIKIHINYPSSRTDHHINLSIIEYLRHYLLYNSLCTSIPQRCWLVRENYSTLVKLHRQSKLPSTS